MTAASLAIGEVAQRTGLPVSTVRYYDDVALISATHRVGGKRRFGSEVVGRVNFIRRAQDAGFSLEEIRLLLNDTARTWPALVDAKLEELSERRTRLDTMIELLTEVRECGCDAIDACPVLPSPIARPGVEVDPDHGR